MAILVKAARAVAPSAAAQRRDCKVDEGNGKAAQVRAAAPLSRRQAVWGLVAGVSLAYASDVQADVSGTVGDPEPSEEISELEETLSDVTANNPEEGPAVEKEVEQVEEEIGELNEQRTQGKDNPNLAEFIQDQIRAIVSNLTGE